MSHNRSAWVGLVVGWGVVAAALAADGVVICQVVDEASGRHLPARLYVLDSAGKPHLPKPGKGETITRYDRTDGTREVYACVGAHPFRFTAPPGKVTVSIERGKEYQPIIREIFIADGQTAEETFRLHRLFDMAAMGWYSGEMHVHRKLRDLPVDQLAEDLNVTFPITAWTFSDREAPKDQGDQEVPEKGELVNIDDTHVYWSG